jgi:hypothetical protein
MLCRSTIDGIPLGEKLSTLTVSNVEKINDDKTDHLNAKTKVSLVPYLPHAELWATLKKQQSMLEDPVLHYWITLD